ncbi:MULTISPECIES: type VI secretion system tube protein TssD [Aquimarina]|uniref:type VI secretion system tube protein TssD n=1 Tax=Aquimarina TaxID=290174 RepID=UPI000CDE9761|nr:MULTISPECIES: type VI secretion system tube protein TssD [Aquimarina]
MIQGTLDLDGESIKVVNYHYLITQGTDHNGMVHSSPVAGKITVSLEVTKAQDTMLNDWALSRTATKKGELHIMDSKGMQVRKKIGFDFGYCVRYEDSMETEGTSQNIVRIVISCGQVGFGDAAKHENNWPQVRQN